MMPIPKTNFVEVLHLELFSIVQMMFLAAITYSRESETRGKTST
jgi:hypothetical protein